jgi:glucose-1-phosphate thymidylyltransferase
MKGVILAGGRGERLSSITRAISKQLLPVYDKPMVYYPLCTVMQCGVREVLVITRPDEVPRFETLLADGTQWGMEISYAVQEAPRGIAEALLIAADFVADEAFALALGDNIFCGPGADAAFAGAAADHQCATIFLKDVPDAGRYGVAAFDEQGDISGILEKPADPPSSYAVTGIYLYDRAAIDYARALVPSERGELEITDVNNAYLADGNISALTLPADVAWLDMGTPDGLHEATHMVAELQAGQETRIGVPEQVALANGWIDAEQVGRIAAGYGDNDYGRYLRSLTPDA